MNESATRRSNTRDTIIESLGWNASTDPFTCGEETEENLETTSAPVGAKRNAEMIRDNMTPRCKMQSER